MQERQKAWIVDLDGCLFRRAPDGRGPYDLTRVTEDLVDPNVSRVMRWARADGYAMLLTSGREDSKADRVRWRTEQALTWGGVGWDRLFMRPDGDPRSDEVVKEWLYRTYIEPYYAVELVLDDRNRVVSMWRERIGLPCWQVAEGNF